MNKKYLKPYFKYPTGYEEEKCFHGNYYAVVILHNGRNNPLKYLVYTDDIKAYKAKLRQDPFDKEHYPKMKIFHKKNPILKWDYYKDDED